MKDNQPIDQLFREGLIAKKDNPPASAWGAIEANLPQKRSKKGLFIYLAIAASVSLVCGFTWSSINSSEEENFRVAEVIKKQPSYEVSIDMHSALRPKDLTEPKQVPVKQLVISAPEENKAQSPRPILIAGIQEVKKLKLSASDLNILTAQQVDIAFALPDFITEPELNESRGGFKFNFIKSLASVAKGVNDGKKALSEIRKSKIEFINEELKFDNEEKISKAQATIDEDSPSNQH